MDSAFPGDPLDGLIEEFLTRYSNRRTRQQNGFRVRDLFRSTGRRWPSELTEADLFRWTTAVPADNSVRQRLSTVQVFFRWCLRHGQGSRRHLAWGRPTGTTRTFYNTVTRRAAEAGLGHVAPHDLRRTAAGIMHRTVSAEDGHVFDLLDIQQVLDHADPSTTQRSYIEPMGHEVKAKAGQLLD